MATQFPGTGVDTNTQLLLAKNNLSCVLSGAHNAAVTTITVNSTTGFPTVGYITIDSEAISYTGTTGTTFTGCTRGADGTTAASHSDAVQVKHTVIADHHNVLKDAIIAVEQYLSDRFGITSNVIIPITKTLTVLSNFFGVDAIFGSSGTPGSIQIFPPTASKGKTLITVDDNSGSTTTTVKTSAQAGARTYDVPDAGASAHFVMTEGAQTLNGNKTLSALIATLAANCAAGGFKITGLAAGSANGDSIRYEQNFIRQAPVFASTLTPTSTTSTSYVDTSLTATITPTSSSSRILVFVTGILCSNGSQNGSAVCATIADGSGNNLCGSAGFCETDLSTTAGAYQGYVGAAAALVHSPATTSAFTYKVQLKKLSGTTTAVWGVANQTQMIVLVEII